MINLEMDSMT